MFKTKRTIFVIALLLLSSFILLPSSLVYSSVPHLINYQGKLTDKANKPLEGAYTLTFRIYDAETAGNLLWEEAQPGVVVQKGVFSILLGSVNPLNIAFDKPYFLEIKVGNEVMSPRSSITSAGYAIRTELSENAEKIKADSGDSSFGYLDNKIDGSSIKLDPTTHKLYIPHGNQFFTSSGTFTPPTGVTRVFITMCGGGGGGEAGQTRHSGGFGGGAGGYVIKYPFAILSESQYTVIVGTGGIGGSETSQADGTNGGNTSFGSLIVTGGLGGAGLEGSDHGIIPGSNNIWDGEKPEYNRNGGKGGCPTSGSGGVGGQGSNTGGGGGGGSAFGAGGAGGSSTSAGSNGSGHGSGGGGGGNDEYNYYAGGSGTPGFVLVEW